MPEMARKFMHRQWAVREVNESLRAYTMLWQPAQISCVDKGFLQLDE